MSTITISSVNPARAKADAVVIGLQAGARGIKLAAGAEAIDEAYGGTLRKTLQAMGATGKPNDLVKLPSSGSVGSPLIVAVGLGAADDLETLRRAAGAAARALAGSAKVVLALPASSAAEVDAVAEGALFGAYAFRTYRSASAADHKAPVKAFELVSSAARTRSAKAALTRSQIVARSVNLVRDLVNTPPSDLRPADLADAATKAARSVKLDVQVTDDKALRRGGYGGLTAVGQGSTHGPRLVRLAYRHPQATKSIALVGKGITFDSGGLSLKPAAAMEWMKSDMGGAAAVLGTLVAAARLKPTVNVTGWLAIAENMPSGSAQRPGDVITIYGGRTVEVLNTDAEGRLVLADALVRAAEEDPDVIVDVATLTGAQLVALGARVSGIMANDDELRDQIFALSTEVGESMWPMPLPDDLRKSLDSPVADLANIGNRYGGMLTAGLFLQEFVPKGTPWAHLDIAGPSYNEGDPYGYTPKGGTGTAVRTLLRLVEDVATTR